PRAGHQPGRDPAGPRNRRRRPPDSLRGSGGRPGLRRGENRAAGRQPIEQDGVIMGLGGILSIARSALFSYQRAMSGSAQNIANAQTQGYTRQTLLLQTAGPWGGVTDRVIRERDAFLDSTWRRESGSLGSATTTRYFLDQIETAVNEPSDSGVGAAL